MSDFTHSQPLFRAEQVRQMDSTVIKVGDVAGIQLMKRAGRAVFEYIIRAWPNCDKLIVCCGAGNNAGDGYVIAGLAAQRKLAIEVLSTCPPETLKGDALRAYHYALQENVSISHVEDWLARASEFTESVVVVDALLGTGFRGELKPEYVQAITTINSGSAAIVAVDLPSGLQADTGHVPSVAVRADATITFVADKCGLHTGRAPAYTGPVTLCDLQISECSEVCLQQLALIQTPIKRIFTEPLLAKLPERDADAHKGQLGHVMLVGGDKGMGGAIALAAETCARSGAGLTSVATQPDHLAPLIARLPEVMTNGVPSGQAIKPLLSRPSVIAIGPGLGQSPWSEQMLQQAAAVDVPMVVDADALNILSQGRVASMRPRPNWVLTPHPGEAARLLSCSIEDIQADRFKAVEQLQSCFGGVVVLKGPGTLIADGNQILVAKVGNAGMATGGMGDVLTGLIAALLAQGMSPLEAACLAVCVHGDAADLVAENSGMRGMLASDLIAYIRELLC